VKSKAMYKRFLVFSYDDYYPNGGLSDVIKSFDDADEAVEYAKSDERGCRGDYIEVFDCDLREFIYQKECEI
jgi:hypothetical protein